MQSGDKCIMQMRVVKDGEYIAKIKNIIEFSLSSDSISIIYKTLRLQHVFLPLRLKTLEWGPEKIRHTI